jgi:enhancing lycopene biosynthesis protein 2
MKKAKKIALVLAGCGNKDGTEITEAVSLIVQLSQLGAELKFFAPDQIYTPVNFINGQKHSEKRNVLEESARIARGNIEELKKLNPSEFDALVFPGGFGAALHLCNWAEKGAKCDVLPSVEVAVREFHRQSKPIAAVCVAPTLLARLLGEEGVTLTLGNDPEVAAEIEKTGAHHVECPVDDYVTDREHKVITSPAYMYGQALPHQVFKGISGLAKELMEMA